MAPSAPPPAPAAATATATATATGYCSLKARWKLSRIGWVM